MKYIISIAGEIVLTFRLRRKF